MSVPSRPAHLLRLAWSRLTKPTPKRRFGYRIARAESYPTRIPSLPVTPHPGYVGTEASLEHHKKHWLSDGYHADLAVAFRKYLGPNFAGSVLEVGCGMGHLHRVIGVRPEQYTGVDLNERFLAAGRAEFPGVTLIQSSADRLPFPDKSFDCVLCCDVLIHLEDMRPALKEIIRVSKSAVLLRLRSGNGAYQTNKMVYDPYQERLFGYVTLEGRRHYGYYNVLAPDDLKAFLAHAGIEKYECEELLPPEAPVHGLTKVFFRVP